MLCVLISLSCSICFYSPVCCLKVMLFFRCSVSVHHHALSLFVSVTSAGHQPVISHDTLNEQKRWILQIILSNFIIIWNKNNHFLYKCLFKQTSLTLTLNICVILQLHMSKNTHISPHMYAQQQHADLNKNIA